MGKLDDCEHSFGMAWFPSLRLAAVSCRLIVLKTTCLRLLLSIVWCVCVSVCVCRTKLDFKKLVTKLCKNDNDVITDVINYIYITDLKGIRFWTGPRGLETLWHLSGLRWEGSGYLCAEPEWTSVLRPASRHGKRFNPKIQTSNLWRLKKNITWWFFPALA